MKTLLVIVVLALRAVLGWDLPLIGGLLQDGDGGAPVVPENAITFRTCEIIVDSGDEPLAAYQIEVRAIAGNVKIVGIEGGEHEEFSDAPYYDTAAMQSERVIIAAFSTAAAETLPRGATRVATLHLQITGDIEPRFEKTLHVAATVDGREIDATVNLNQGPNP